MHSRLRAVHGLVCAALLCACSDGDESAEASGTDGDDGQDTVDEPQPGARPFRDQWRVVHEGPLAAAIDELVIGSAFGHSDNFMNRGDVIVEFDGAPGTIRVELRRFTFAESQAQADDVYARLGLWSYRGAAESPARPDQMDEALRCGCVDEGGAPRPWHPDCVIYIYYEGQTQLQRAGADIRVTLGPEFRGTLAIATSDNSAEDSYPNRGNVCVDGLPGNADIALHNGIALVSIAVDAPYPTCPDEWVAQCEAFDDPSTPGPDAWAAACPCLAQLAPGQVRVESLAPSSADITVDAPGALWTSFRAENSGDNRFPGKHCPAVVEGLQSVEFAEGGNDPSRPWLRAGIANRPPAAPAGGYRIDLNATGCELVASVESPEAWSPELVAPPAELRGMVTICDGCLAGQRCDALLPGG